MRTADDGEGFGFYVMTPASAASALTLDLLCFCCRTDPFDTHLILFQNVRRSYQAQQGK